MALAISRQGRPREEEGRPPSLVTDSILGTPKITGGEVNKTSALKMVDMEAKEYQESKLKA